MRCNCLDYGPVPSTALVLVDVIQDLEYPGGEQLLPSATIMAERTAILKRRARRRGIPAIYLNENDNRFRPSFSRQLERCLHEAVRGRPIAERLRPENDDLFMLRSQQSAGLVEGLDGLLRSLHAGTLIFAGIAASVCVLLTANDTYLSGFRLLVPRDCLAAKTEADKHHALQQMEYALDVDTRPSDELAPLLASAW